MAAEGLAVKPVIASRGAGRRLDEQAVLKERL
jgi:hypothetical protein